MQVGDIDQSSSWVDINSLALHDPIPILKHTRKKHLMSQMPFKLLVNCCIGDAPSALVRCCQARKGRAMKHQFGVQVPVGAKQAFVLDRAAGNTLWSDSMKKELAQLHKFDTFTTLEPGQEAPEGHKKIPHHMVLAVKFDLRRKS